VRWSVAVSAFVQQLLDTLAQKRTHLAIFRMWWDEHPTPECRDVLQVLIANTTQMIDTIVAALRQEGVRPPDPEPDPRLIREAKKPPHARACLHWAEQTLRRSLAWYEERMSQAGERERPVWERLFLLESENWARVEDAITP